MTSFLGPLQDFRATMRMVSLLAACLGVIACLGIIACWLAHTI